MATDIIRLSSKGQLVIPKAIRHSHGWDSGQQSTVEVTKDGILLRPASPFPVSTVEKVAGCLGYQGSALL